VFNILTSKTKGFTVTELMVAAVLGIIVLSSLLSFFLRSSKLVNQQQTQIKDLSQFQFVMNKIVQDIKDLNTEAPETGSVVTKDQWEKLPHLQYTRLYTDDPGYSAIPNEYVRIIPTYPVAYNFSYQANSLGSKNSWYPIPTETESNSLAFYKIIQGQVHRILYIKVGEKLQRRDQIITNACPCTSFINPVPKVITLIDNVEFVHFTYPSLQDKILNDSSFVSQLNAVSGDTNEKVYMQNVLMNEYRDIIGIRIALSGTKIGKDKAKTLDLSTEVNIRN